MDWELAKIFDVAWGAKSAEAIDACVRELDGKQYVEALVVTSGGMRTRRIELSHFVVCILDHVQQALRDQGDSHYEYRMRRNAAAKLKREERKRDARLVTKYAKEHRDELHNELWQQDHPKKEWGPTVTDFDDFPF